MDAAFSETPRTAKLLQRFGVSLFAAVDGYDTHCCDRVVPESGEPVPKGTGFLCCEDCYLVILRGIDTLSQQAARRGRYLPKIQNGPERFR
mgnify:CR=1 FL=1